MDNRERTRARDKNKGDNFFLETHENFIAVVRRKWGMLAASKMKMNGSAKESEQEHKQHFFFVRTYNISSIKSVFSKLESFTL